MSSYNDCKPISRINMGIWLVELSHIPLCEEFEPEAHCKEIAFRFAWPNSTNARWEGNDSYGTYEKKILSQNLTGCMETSNRLQSEQTHLTIVLMPKLHWDVSCRQYFTIASAKGIFLYLASRLSNELLVFRNAVMSSSRRANSSRIYSLVPYTASIKTYQEIGEWSVLARCLMEAVGWKICFTWTYRICSEHGPRSSRSWSHTLWSISPLVQVEFF